MTATQVACTYLAVGAVHAAASAVMLLAGVRARLFRPSWRMVAIVGAALLLWPWVTCTS